MILDIDNSAFLVFILMCFNSQKDFLMNGVRSYFLCIQLCLFYFSLFARAGDLDPTFGNNGTIITQASINPDRFATAGINTIGIQKDGKIVVAGYANDRTSNLAFALGRYLPNGYLDTTFGTYGISVNQIILICL